MDYAQSQITHDITQYGSIIIIIGIAMVFVFSQYIREIQFLLQVNSTSDDFTAYKMSKQNCKIRLHLHFRA